MRIESERANEMNPGTLLIRADASSEIGTGHVMRCLALAQAWQDRGGDTLLAAVELPVEIEQRLHSEKVCVARLPEVAGSPVDASVTASLACQHGAKWVVVDGEAFGAEFLEHLRRSGLRTLLIDDCASRKTIPADLIANPNFGATKELYSGINSGAKLLLGEQYILLRREFTSWKKQKRFTEKGNRLFVCLGGSDPDNRSLSIVEILRGVPGLRITVVAGPGYCHLEQLQELSSEDVRVLFDPRDVPALMDEADIAVIAAGGTLWELLYMRCAVASYARNEVQMRILKTLAQQGVVVELGWAQDLNKAKLASVVKELVSSRRRREEMGNAGREIIDGLGASRALQALQLS
jgi:UDP-2,4-diacetamido-2,4,6-trideoxy-beta-L-altropyranose hydrolase